MIDVQIPGYRVLRTLGAGGMATVYLAEQESLEREVALKVMAPALAANADFCQQFLKEGRITAKLSHPNLVTVHDIGSHNGTYYMASEFLPAGSLRERMQRGLTVGEAVAIARDVASGLGYAHEMGFVHRDVKPGNILFRASGSAVLADFGIAKAMKSISSATMAGNAIGTPDYMSPEQAQASPVDGRTDLYSLGAVLYEMLTGSKPYIADDPYVVALRHVTEPVPRLPEALDWLQLLIDRTMAKNREERFATGLTFIAECDTLLATHPEFATHPRSGRQAGRAAPPAAGDASAWIDRLPRRVAALVAAGIVAVAGVVVAWRWPRPAPAPVPHETVLPASPQAPAREEAASRSGDPAVNPELGQLDTVTLLTRASGYLKEGLASGDGMRFAFPDGDNAIDLFREVLRREPGNVTASKGLAQIADFYARGAQGLLDKGLDDVTAAELVEKGLRAQPDNAGLLKLKTRFAARASVHAG